MRFYLCILYTESSRLIKNILWLSWCVRLWKLLSLFPIQSISAAHGYATLMKIWIVFHCLKWIFVYNVFMQWECMKLLCIVIYFLKICLSLIICICIWQLLGGSGGCAHMWIKVQASRECVWALEASARGGCELLDVVVLAKLWSSARLVCSVILWSISPVLE